MANICRPSLDVLVPLVMIENTMMIESPSCEPQKEVLRHFESGDLVLVKSDSQYSPAIVFNVSGLVMKFDIDRQLYHVCLLDSDFTEQWVDAVDTIIYSKEMMAEFDNEPMKQAWALANELFEIQNNEDEKIRLDEFKKRFNEARHQQVPLSSTNTTRKSRKTRTSIQTTVRASETRMLSPLTVCEELLIVELIHRSSQFTFAEAKQVAENTYRWIICTNNRENTQSSASGSVRPIPDQWFITFAVRQIDYLRQYAKYWLSDLKTLKSSMTNIENDKDLCSLIALMEQ